MSICVHIRRELSFSVLIILYAIVYNFSPIYDTLMIIIIIFLFLFLLFLLLLISFYFIL